MLVFETITVTVRTDLMAPANSVLRPWRWSPGEVTFSAPVKRIYPCAGDRTPSTFLPLPPGWSTFMIPL